MCFDRPYMFCAGVQIPQEHIWVQQKLGHDPFKANQKRLHMKSPKTPIWTAPLGFLILDVGAQL